jgi:hypothetical protein
VKKQGRRMSGGHPFCADRSGAETQNHITKYNIKYIGYGELIEMLSIFLMERTDKMKIIFAEYNMYHNSIDIATYAFKNLIYLFCQTRSFQILLPPRKQNTRKR